MKKTKNRTEDLGSTLDLEELEQLIAKAKRENWNNFYIHAESHGYDGAFLEGNYSSIETDAEYESRVAYEQKESQKKVKDMAKKREQEKKLYEKLKKQFEGGV